MSSPADDQLEQHTKEPDASGELTFDEAIALFNDSKKYVDTGYRTEWDKYFKVYSGKRVIRNYEGISDPVIRESHTIIETLVANIASGYPKFHFVPTNEEQYGDTEVLNEMLDYYMICNQMGLKNQEWVRDMLLYGTGVLGVEWREGEPFIFNIPLRDYFFDATSTGITQTLNPAQYAGYEYLADKSTLSGETIYDAEQDKWVPRYQNLDKLSTPPPDPKGGGAGSRGMDKRFKDLFKGSTLGEKAVANQVHVIKMYHLPTGRLYEIGNKEMFIYNQPTWTQRKAMTRKIMTEVDGQQVEGTQTLDEIKPFLPFAILRDYIDSSQHLGTGEMALIMQDAELLNDYEAMQVDNNAYQNTPMYWIDPQFADLAPEIETIPGAVYPIPRNAMGALERPQLTTDIDNKEELILQRMRRATGADEVIQGSAPSSSRTTATEVNSTLQQAQTRFSTKISNLESEGYAQLGLLIFKMVQIFVTKKTAVRIAGKMGVYFKDFDPWAYNGKWEAHVLLDSTIKQNQVEVGLKDQAVYDSLKNTPGIDQVALARWWIQKKDPDMTDDEFNEMLAPPPPPEPPKAEDLLQVAYKDLEPWGRAQAQKMMGWQPDPSLVGDMQNRMLEQANQAADHLDPATRADGSVVPGLENLINPPQPTPAQMPSGPAPAAMPA